MSPTSVSSLMGSWVCYNSDSERLHRENLPGPVGGLPPGDTVRASARPAGARQRLETLIFCSFNNYCNHNN